MACKKAEIIDNDASGKQPERDGDLEVDDDKSHTTLTFLARR
jgi:hypothetical protein